VRRHDQAGAPASGSPAPVRERQADEPRYVVVVDVARCGTCLAVYSVRAGHVCARPAGWRP
jgi:hypothetical protein